MQQKLAEQKPLHRGVKMSKCGIAVFSEPVGCGFLTFWTVLKIILVLQCFQCFFQFPIGLSIHGNGKLQFLIKLLFVNY